MPKHIKAISDGKLSCFNILLIIWPWPCHVSLPQGHTLRSVHDHTNTISYLDTFRYHTNSYLRTGYTHYMRFKEVFQSHWLRMPGINPFTQIDLHSVRWQSLSMQQVGQGLCLSLCLKQNSLAKRSYSCCTVFWSVLATISFNFCPRAQLGPSFVFASFTLRLPQCIFLSFSSKQALDL